MKKDIKNDVTGGARAYNRLKMQISQSILFAVEFYTLPEFLIVMDYYDDISIFKGETMENEVCHYQMKTSDNSITLAHIFKEDWLVKLYNHIKSGKFNVEEIGLIITGDIKDGNKKIISNPQTQFNSMEQNIQDKIKEHLAEKCNCPLDEVDFSKFVFIKTELTISSHKKLAEQQFGELLHNINSNIGLGLAKSIFNTLFQLLSDKQAVELDEKAEKELVKKHKSFSRKDLKNIIGEHQKIDLPQFKEIEKYIYQENIDECRKGYLNILDDSRENNGQYYELFDKIRESIKNLLGNTEVEVTIPNIINWVKEDIRKIQPLNNHVIRNDYYIETLIFCILVIGEKNDSV